MKKRLTCGLIRCLCIVRDPPLIQWPDEAASMVDLILAENVQSYLEIGLSAGATFWYVGQRLPAGSKMVGIDWMNGRKGLRPAECKSLGEIITRLREAGIHARLIVGDSRSKSVIRAVKALSPYDFIFIDAEHSYECVRSDWENYGHMGRIVSFHDIDAEKYGVGKFWQEIKSHYRHIEIIGDKRGFGHGILWQEP